MTPQPAKPEPLHVTIYREPFSDFYLLTTPVNGHTEELEVEDVREWFKIRGASQDAVDKALDQAWNFRRAAVLIQKPRVPVEIRLPYSPDI